MAKKKAVKKPTKKLAGKAKARGNPGTAKSKVKKKTAQKPTKKGNKTAKSKRTGTTKGKRGKDGRTKRRKALDIEVFTIIEDAVANGADTNKAIATALGWGVSTFKNYRYGRKDDPSYIQFMQPIETAIKKGNERLRPALLRLAETSLAKMVGGFEYDEVHREEKRVPTGTLDAQGNPKFRVEQKLKNVKKFIPPSPTLIMFTAVNCGDGKWESINKQVERGGDDKAGILKNIDRMLDV